MVRPTLAQATLTLVEPITTVDLLFGGFDTTMSRTLQSTTKVAANDVELFVDSAIATILN